MMKFVAVFFVASAAVAVCLAQKGYQDTIGASSSEVRTVVGILRSIQQSVRDKSANESAVIASHYTSWTEWSKCSKRCRQRRSRRCQPQAPSSCKTAKEVRVCSDASCLFGGARREAQRLPSENQPAGTSKNYKVLYSLQPFVYAPWSEWGPCSSSCHTRRHRKCAMPFVCGTETIEEDALCFAEGTPCEVLKPKTDAEQFVRMNAVSDNQAWTVQSGFECGRAPVTPQLRIMGGQTSREGKWPWQVAILTKEGDHICGGTIVAPGWVLTAAHCLRGKLLVVAGEHNLKQRRLNAEIRVTGKFVHPEYDTDTIDNDVALLKLETPLVFNDKIRPACLPQRSLQVGEVGTILGWGKVREGANNGSDVLREAEVPIVAQPLCRRAYREYYISENMVCAGYKRGRIDSCSGDSGGPLLAQDRATRRWSIYGVTSFGEGCGLRYGIYARVETALDWIRKTIETM